MFQEKLKKALSQYQNAGTLWVAFSGGVDSHVLLHALCQTQKTETLPPVKAIHVNHNLQNKALSWQAHCKDICSKLDIEFHTSEVHCHNQQGLGTEGAARVARYNVFEGLLEEGDVMLMAHHQNDDIETLLLRLLRGAGLEGLSGIKRMRTLGKGILLRPFLDIAKEDILAYANEHTLNWIEDSSNEDLSYDRNYIRHDIIPRLETRFKGVKKVLARTTKVCSDTMGVLEAYLKEELVNVTGSEPATLSKKALLNYSKSKQRLLIRQFFKEHAIDYPSDVKLNDMIKGLILSGDDKAPSIPFGVWVARRFRDDIVFHKQDDFNVPSTIKWQLDKPLEIPGLGILKAKRTIGTGIKACDMAFLEVRFRRGGERIRPFKSQHTKSLKNLFLSWNVPTWERDRVPFLYDGEHLVCVVGYCISHDYHVRDIEEGFSVSLTANLSEAVPA